jgi:hypothetical protein
MSPRHGLERLKQMENLRGKITGMKVSGAAKRFAALSNGQLRAMFPQISHLNDVELRREALKLISER